MPPKKTGQGRSNQRQTNHINKNQISEFSDLKLFEHLSREDIEIEDLLESIKDVSDTELRENTLQNFATLTFQLIGLNSFVIKLEGKSFSSIDGEFIQTEIEQNLKKVKDFNWVFTTRNEENKIIKDNLYIFFDSLITQNQYYQTDDDNLSFFDQLTSLFVLLSKTNIQNARQNVLRLTRIFVEQGLLKLEKLKSAEKRKLDKEELLIQKGLEKIILKLIKQIFCARLIDKSEHIQQDSLESFEIFFSICPSITLISENLIQLSTLLDGNIELVNNFLKLLITIKWKESESNKAALDELFKNDRFRKRIIYYSTFTTFVTAFRSILLINIYEQLFPSSLKEKELRKVFSCIFHQYEEVRGEGLKIFNSFLQIKDSETKMCKIVLDGEEDASIKDIFLFKQVPAESSIGLIKRFYELLDQIDSKIYEKEELIQNLVNTLGFEFGPLFDFQSIFKLLNQLPSSNLKNKIFDLFKLIIVVLKRTMKLFTLIEQGQNIAYHISKVQKEKLLLIRSEFFQALTNNFDQLYENMNNHIIFKEYAYHLFLSIPVIDLQQNLKESQFKSFAKAIANDIFKTISNQDQFIKQKSISMGLIFNCFSALQYFILYTPRAYSDIFQMCKEKVIKTGILEDVVRIHEIIVQGQETSLSLQEQQEDYTFLFIKLFSCTSLLNQLEGIYNEEFIISCLEITDAATSSTSTDNTCIYTFSSLGLQLDFYLNVLKQGLYESSTKQSRLEEYARYRLKVIKQLWSFLREERKKAIQFNLSTEEYKIILIKSYSFIIQGLQYVSHQNLNGKPIQLKVQNDDPIFYALIDYISYYNPSEYNQNNADDDNKPSKKNKKMLSEKEEQEEERKIEKQILPIDEKYFMPNLSNNGKEITDLLFIILNFCQLTLANPKYLYSIFGIYVFKNFFDSNSKEVVEVLKKSIAVSRLIEDKSSGYPPFWKCFNDVINSMLDEKRDLAQVKKFVAFAHKAYFTENITDRNGASIKPKQFISQLIERQVYYLIAQTTSLLENPSKLSTLEILGYMLSLKVVIPKSLDEKVLQELIMLKKKYHMLFMKKIQDYVISFKENNTHLQSFDDTILSDYSKQIVYRYLKNLENWSTFKFNIDPYGDGEEVLNQQREAAERSIKKQDKQTDDEDSRDRNVEEESNQSNDEQDDDDDDEEEEIQLVKEDNNKKNQNRKSKRGNSTTRNSSKKDDDSNNKKMEAENKENQKPAVRKTKKSNASTKTNPKNTDNKKVEVSKKNYRRQPNKQ